MNDDYLVDPELRELIASWPVLELDQSCLPLIRQPGRAPIDSVARPDHIGRAEVRVQGSQGGPEVRLVVYRPTWRTRDKRAAILHIHGGGFVAGSVDIMEPLHWPLVETLNCVLVSVDYRLAPETPYPGPLEDCYAGLTWLFRNADELGVDPGLIGVMGESAGGGLAAALSLLARDRGEFSLRFQHLIYPMLDDRTCLAEPHQFAGEYIWTPQNNRFGWRSYLGADPGSAEISPYAAPARMADLSGLPSTFIAAGALDLFAEENMEYGRRLMRAGVPTELHIYPGAVHGFDIASADVARRSVHDSRAALARFFKPLSRDGAS